MSKNSNRDQLRATIANEAARIIHDSGLRDYNIARAKAAHRLGCKDRRRQPSNAEIEQALEEYQQLFHSNEQQSSTDCLRQLALDAMSNLEQFTPHLTGPALSGNANFQSQLQLHLFSESPEQIALHLVDNGIPYQEIEKYISLNRGQKQLQPAFSLFFGETEIELIWFPPSSIGHPPLSPIDQKPEKRASIAQLKRLIGLTKINN